MFVAINSVFAQGTAFTYQGRLNANGNTANGSYDFTFSLYGVSSGADQVGNSVTNVATIVSSGLFTVTLDFGNQFLGGDRWLEIGVRTNGSGAFTTLSPRQKLTPDPYAIFANTTSNLAGMVSNDQLANSTISVTAGTGLGGGGIVALGGSTTLSNTGVRSVVGNADITASTLNGVVTLGGNASSTNNPNTIIKRDANGSFSAGSINLNGTLNLTSPNSLTVGGNQLVLRDGGPSTSQNVGIGVSTPLQKLHVAGNIQMDGQQFICANGGFYLWAAGNIYLNGVGVVNIGPSLSGAPVNFSVSGDADVRTLTIRGGADLAEPFHISSSRIPEGSVVVIDVECPGQLKLSDHAYDTRVAGIVSGANGIQPGLSLSQKGTIEGGQNVALTGRVYALADASYAPIEPGDLLTTSDTPGHCMKVSDHTSGQGAIVGKAMSTLAKGKGIVLVLISLQ
jgi:hypothetical protein